MTLTVTDTAARLRALLATTTRALRQSGGRGLSLGQLSVLSSLDARGPQRMGELAHAEGIDPALATRLVGHLEESGHVRRSSDPVDRRANLVAITPVGRKALAGVRDERVAELSRRLEALSSHDLRIVHDALDVLDGLF
jgi:DNA-binding MarR family transcriptional regulator